jgi:hypothetical protein
MSKGRKKLRSFSKILLLSINIEIISFLAIDLLLAYCYSMTGEMSSVYDEDEAPLPVPMHASRSGVLE